jgi:hypothetical protein
MAIVKSAHIDNVLNQFQGKQFTTLDYIDKFKMDYPDDWGLLVAKYGQGGSGCGAYYSANSYIAQILSRRKERGEVNLLNFTKAPQGWGNSVIALWQK